MERELLISETIKILSNEGFRISSFIDTNSCFDILAKKGKNVIALKVLANVDSLREEQALELKKFGNVFGVNVFIIGQRTKTQRLKDHILYERYRIAVITPRTLRESLKGVGISIKHFKGRDIVEIDSTMLRRCRENSGLSLQGVADSLNLTKESIHRFETKAVSSLNNAKRLEKLFKCNLIKKIDIISEKMESKITDDEFFPDPLLRKMHNIGFKVSAFEHAPLRAVGSEKSELLVERAKERKEIERKAEQLGKIKDAIESDAVIFAKDLKGKKVDDVALVSDEELEGMRKPKELIKLVKEREHER